MARQPKLDPYCNFKDDHERRIALNVRARWRSSATMVVAFASVSIDWTEKIQWLMSLFH